MAGVRPLLNETIRHTVMARLTMEELQYAVVREMKAGFRPTYRGHAWSSETIATLESAGLAIEVAFHLLKAVQFPESSISRRRDAEAALLEFRAGRPAT